MASPTQPPAAGGGKVLGLKPRTAFIAGAAILAAAIGYMLWKRHQSAATPATTSASASSSTSGIDYGGELSVIQSELEDLLAASGQSSSSTGTGTTTTGTGAGTGTTTATGTGTTTTAAKTAAPAMPTGVTVSNVTTTSFVVHWAPDPHTAMYRVRVTYQDKLVKQAQVGPVASAAISGLSPNRTYTVHVAAGNAGGFSSETNGPTVKTKL
jgi:Fibronectin type III domain